MSETKEDFAFKNVRNRTATPHPARVRPKVEHFSSGEIFRLARAAGISRLGVDAYPRIENYLVNWIREAGKYMTGYLQGKQRKTVTSEAAAQLVPEGEQVAPFDRDQFLIRSTTIDRLLRSALPEDFHVSKEGLWSFQAAAERNAVKWLAHMSSDQLRKHHKTLNAVDTLVPVHPVHEENTGHATSVEVSFDSRLKEKWGIADRKLRKILDTMIQAVVHRLVSTIRQCSHDKGNATIRGEDISSCSERFLPPDLMLVQAPEKSYVGVHTMKRMLSSSGRRVSQGASEALSILVHRIVDTLLSLLAETSYDNFLNVVKRHPPVRALLVSSGIQGLNF